MCVDPGSLPNGQTIACRKCWQCKENRIQDWVGRSIAESRTAGETRCVTLTYGGGDTERATVLTYSDVQKYLKQLRNYGYVVKYLCAGEYGSRKGRAHWHLILFFEGSGPDRPLRQNINCPYWPHGYSFWDAPSPQAVRYVCKYVVKDIADNEAQAHFQMSKKPPIGSEYFDRLAWAYAKNGISPQDLMYKFRENKNLEGKLVQHYMHGATARDFIEAFMRHWRDRHGNDMWPNSSLIEEYLDKKACYAPDPVLADRAYGRAPHYPPDEGAIVSFHEPSNQYRALLNDKWWHWVAVDKNDLVKGEWVWQRKEDGKTVAWLQSPRYLEMCKRQEVAHLEASLRRESTTLRPVIGKHGKTARPSAKALSRLPMVGDKAVLDSHRAAQARWARRLGPREPE